MEKDAVSDNEPSQHKQIPQDRTCGPQSHQKEPPNRGVLGVRGQRSLPREGEGGLHRVLGACSIRLWLVNFIGGHNSLSYTKNTDLCVSTRMCDMLNEVMCIWAENIRESRSQESVPWQNENRKQSKELPSKGYNMMEWSRRLSSSTWKQVRN